jgi:hypothetical protein
MEQKPFAPKSRNCFYEAKKKSRFCNIPGYEAGNRENTDAKENLKKIRAFK